MYRPSLERGSPGGPVPIDPREIPVGGYRAVMSPELEVVALFQTQYRIIRLAKLAGALDDGLEDGSHFGRRGRYHPQNIAAPGLIGERLGKVACLCLNLIEQPDVLNGNCRLVGKGGSEFDLLVAERTHLGTCQANHADRYTFAQHWNT